MEDEGKFVLNKLNSECPQSVPSEVICCSNSAEEKQCSCDVRMATDVEQVSEKLLEELCYNKKDTVENTVIERNEVIQECVVSEINSSNEIRDNNLVISNAGALEEECTAADKSSTPKECDTNSYRSPQAIDLKRNSGSLALISSLYDYSSDSDSDNKSLTDGCSEHQFDCLTPSSEKVGSSESEDSSESDIESIIAHKPSFIPKPLKVRGELNIQDLPPIEDLHISVKEEECIPFGKVYSIVDTLLVVQSLPDKPALNLESIFFRHNGDPVGRIFDVFGPVKRPFYSVRFNSNKEIREKRLEVDVVVYAAPKTEHAQYVFAHQLMKEKGSDASWVNDIEPPAECIEFSDDEEERLNRRKQRNPVAIKDEVTEDDSPARKKYLTYEERMNRNNVMRNKYYSRMKNPSTFKRTWDVGWHNRIDRSIAAPLPRSAVPHVTQGAFHMRPPLFIPPVPSAAPPPPIRSSPSSPFSPNPAPFSTPNQPPAIPAAFNPHQPPPGWLGQPSRLPRNSFGSSCSSIHSPPTYSQVQNSQDMYYQYQTPPNVPQPPPQFSSCVRSSNFMQFPPFPPGGNSF